MDNSSQSSNGSNNSPTVKLNLYNQPKQQLVRTLLYLKKEYHTLSEERLALEKQLQSLRPLTTDSNHFESGNFEFELKSQINQLKEQNNLLKAEHYQIVQQLQHDHELEKQGIYQNIEDLKVHYERELRAIEQQLTRAANQQLLSGFDSRLQQYLHEIELREARQQELETQKANLQKTLQDLQQNYNQVVEKLEQTSLKLTKKEAETSNIGKQIQQLRSEKQAQQKELKRMQDDLIQTKIDRKQALEQADVVREELSVYKMTASKDKEVQKLLSLVAELQSESKKSSTEQNSALSSLSNTVSELTTENNNLRKQLQKVRDTLRKKTEELQRLLAKQAGNIEAQEARAANYKALQQRLVEAELVNKCNINLLNQKNALAEKHQEELARRAKEISQLKAAVSEAEQKKEELVRSLRQKELELRRNQEQLRQSQEKNSVLYNKAGEAEALKPEFTKLREQLQQRKKTERQLNLEVRSLQEDNKKALEKIQSQAVELKTTQESRNRVNQELVRLSAMYQESQLKEQALREQYQGATQRIQILLREKASGDKVAEYKELMDSVSKLNQQLNAELKGYSAQIEQLTKQAANQEAEARSSLEAAELRARQAEKQAADSTSESAHWKLQSANLGNEKKFLEIKLEEARKDKEHVEQLHKQRLERAEQQVKHKEQALQADREYFGRETAKYREQLEASVKRISEMGLQIETLRSQAVQREAAIAQASSLTEELRRKHLLQVEGLRRKQKAVEQQAQTKFKNLENLVRDRDEEAIVAAKKYAKLQEESVAKAREYEQEISRIKSLCSAQESKLVVLSELTDENSRLKAAKQRLINDMNKHTLRHVDSNKQLQFLKTENKTLKRQTQNMRNTIYTLKQEADQRHKQIQSLRREGDALKKQNFGFQSQIESVKDTASKRINSLNHDLDQLKQQLHSVRKQFEVSNTEATNWKQKAEALKIERKDLDRKIAETQRKLLEGQTAMKKLSHTFAVRAEKEESTRLNFQALKDKYEALRISSKAEIDELRTELDTLQSAKAEERKLTQGKYSEVRGEAEQRLSIVNKKHEAEVRRLKQKEAKTSEQLAKTQRDKQELYDQLVHLKQAKQELSIQLQSRDSQIKNLKAMVQQLNSQNADMRREAEHTSNLSMEQKRYIKKLEQQLRESQQLRELVHQLEQKSQALQQKLESSRKDFGEQHRDIRSANSDLAEVKAEYSNLLRMHNSLIDKHKALEETAKFRSSTVFQERKGYHSGINNISNNLGSSRLSTSRGKSPQGLGLPTTGSSKQLTKLQTAVPGSLELKGPGRSAELCWLEIQQKIKAVKHENDMLKNYSYKPTYRTSS